MKDATMQIYLLHHHVDIGKDVRFIISRNDMYDVQMHHTYDMH